MRRTRRIRTWLRGRPRSSNCLRFYWGGPGVFGRGCGQSCSRESATGALGSCGTCLDQTPRGLPKTLALLGVVLEQGFRGSRRQGKMSVPACFRRSAHLYWGLFGTGALRLPLLIPLGFALWLGPSCPRSFPGARGSERQARRRVLRHARRVGARRSGAWESLTRWAQLRSRRRASRARSRRRRRRRRSWSSCGSRGPRPP